MTLLLSIIALLLLLLYIPLTKGQITSATSSPSSSGSTSPSATMTVSSTPSISTSTSPSVSASAFPSYPSDSPSASASAFPSYASNSPSASSSAFPSYASESPSASASALPSYPSESPSASASAFPSFPSYSPTASSSALPSFPTFSPTASGSSSFTTSPSISAFPSFPSYSPTASVSAFPSFPSYSPTASVSAFPSYPSDSPTASRSAFPSYPSNSATASKSAFPSFPSYSATASASALATSTATLTCTPSTTPSPTQTPTPSLSEGASPSNTPSSSPSPTGTPTGTSTPTPTGTPTTTPTPTSSLSVGSSPSRTPTRSATKTPTSSATPTSSSTPTPSRTPSLTVGATPSNSPSTTRTMSPSNTQTPSRTISRSPTVTPSLTKGASPSSSMTSTPSLSPSPNTFERTDAYLLFSILLLPLARNKTLASDFFKPNEILSLSVTSPLRLDLSRILMVGVARIVVMSVTDLSTEVTLNGQIDKQISEYLGRRQRLLQGGTTPTSQPKKLYPGLNIEIAIGLGRTPDMSAVTFILNSTAYLLQTAMENTPNTLFLPLFSSSLLTETSTTILPVSYSIFADLSTLRFISAYNAPIKSFDIIGLIAGSSSVGGVIAIFLTLTAIRAYYAYRLKLQVALQTIKPILFDNPLRKSRTIERGKLNQQVKAKIFLPLPGHALEIQNRKLMDIRFKEQQQLIEQERKHEEDAINGPEIVRQRALTLLKKKEEEEAKLAIKVKELEHSLDMEILEKKKRQDELQNLIRNIRSGAYRHAWVKLKSKKDSSNINIKDKKEEDKEKEEEEEEYYMPFGDRLCDVTTRPREWVLGKGNFEVLDPKISLDSSSLRNCYIRKEETDGFGVYGRVWYEHKLSGARKERLPYGGIISSCETIVTVF